LCLAKCKKLLKICQFHSKMLKITSLKDDRVRHAALIILIIKIERAGISKPRVRLKSSLLLSKEHSHSHKSANSKLDPRPHLKKLLCHNYNKLRLNQLRWLICLSEQFSCNQSKKYENNQSTRLETNNSFHQANTRRDL